LARIKLKLGENEIEVDSRDFYVDNQTLGEIIDNISHHLPENHAKIVYETDSIPESTQAIHPAQYGLENLDDAEVYEPEFNEPNMQIEKDTHTETDTLIQEETHIPESEIDR